MDLLALPAPGLPQALVIGISSAVGAAISMAFAEALSDTGAETGRGHPFMRGLIVGAATFLGGILHTLPFLISDMGLLFHSCIRIPKNTVCQIFKMVCSLRFTRFVNLSPRQSLADCLINMAEGQCSSYLSWGQQPLSSLWHLRQTLYFYFWRERSMVLRPVISQLLLR
jgi:hypothetical protein